MTLKLKLVLDMVKMYLYAEYELSTCNSWKVIPQTKRQTHKPDWNYHLSVYADGNKIEHTRIRMGGIPVVSVWSMFRDSLRVPVLLKMHTQWENLPPKENISLIIANTRYKKPLDEFVRERGITFAFSFLSVRKLWNPFIPKWNQFSLGDWNDIYLNGSKKNIRILLKWFRFRFLFRSVWMGLND